MKNTIGNLILLNLGKNKSASNSTFDEKKKVYKLDDHLILNREVINSTIPSRS